MISYTQIFQQLGAKPSISEENGLSQIRDTDLTIFSPGISTGGFAEVRMVKNHPNRNVIATTIDEKGMAFARKVIKELGCEDHIEVRKEDLREEWIYEENQFDFIYARLVLHYLSFDELNHVLANFHNSLKQNGKLFVVVRSDKNITSDDEIISFDHKTRFTAIKRYFKDSDNSYIETRYFHSIESISGHLERAGLIIEKSKEYREQLYMDFSREKVSPNFDHLIEITAIKS